MSEDLERGYDDTKEVSAESVEPQERWLIPAIRRQNRLFGVATVLVLIGITVVFLVGGYNETEEMGLEEFDANAGAIGNDADNAKMQKALNHLLPGKTGKAASHLGGLHGITLNPGQMSPFMKHDNGTFDILTGLKRNHTLDKLTAHLARMNRTHPALSSNLQLGPANHPAKHNIQDLLNNGLGSLSHHDIVNATSSPVNSTEDEGFTDD